MAWESRARDCDCPAAERSSLRAVRVHFYSHSIHRGRQPSVWYVLLDVAGRMISPRYTRCTLEVGDTIYCVTRDGWRRVPARTYLFPASATVETMADVGPLERAEIPQTLSPRRLTVVQVATGFLFPRRVDHCSTLIGPLVGCGRVRTPDRLHDMLVARRGRRIGEARAVERAAMPLAHLTGSATSAGGAESGGA